MYTYVSRFPYHGRSARIESARVIGTCPPRNSSRQLIHSAIPTANREQNRGLSGLRHSRRRRVRFCEIATRFSRFLFVCSSNISFNKGLKIDEREQNQETRGRLFFFFFFFSFVRNARSGRVALTKGPEHRKGCSTEKCQNRRNPHTRVLRRAQISLANKSSCSRKLALFTLRLSSCATRSRLLSVYTIRDNDQKSRVFPHRIYCGTQSNAPNRDDRKTLAYLRSRGRAGAHRVTTDRPTGRRSIKNCRCR